MKRVLLILAVLIVVLIAGLFVGTLLLVNSVARKAVEQGGTYALGVATTLERAQVSIFNGTFGMHRLNVANPEGFESEHFLRLGHGHMALTIGSLAQDVIELPVLLLEDISLVLERRDGKANYDVIMENLQRFESKDDDAPEKDGPGVIIREITIRNVHVRADLVPAGGSLTRIDVPIDLITLRNVGTDGADPVPVSEIFAIVFKAILNATIENAGGLLSEDLLGDLRGRLAGLESIGNINVEGVRGAAEDAAREAQERLRDVGGAAKDAADEARRGIGGLLRRDRDTDNESPE